MWGATDDELKELAAVVALTSFWSNVLHTQNYEYDTFVRTKADGRVHDKEQEPIVLISWYYLFMKIF